MTEKAKISLIGSEGVNEFRAAVEAMKRSIPDHIEFSKVKAEIRKASYDAYIQEGFSDVQALELCKLDI